MIDRNARAILEKDEFEDLSLAVVTDIISRDSLCLRDETDKEAMAKVTKVEPGDSSSCKYQILWCCMFCLVLVFSVY